MGPRELRTDELRIREHLDGAALWQASGSLTPSKGAPEKRQMNHEGIGIPLSSEIFVGESDNISAKA